METLWEPPFALRTNNTDQVSEEYNIKQLASLQLIAGEEPRLVLSIGGREALNYPRTLSSGRFTIAFTSDICGAQALLGPSSLNLETMFFIPQILTP